MTHPGELLSAFLDGELGQGEAKVVFAHLAECTPCRQELTDLDAARSAVRGLPLLEPPPFVFEPPVAAVVALRSRVPRWSVRVAAAAAAALVGFASLGVLRGESTAPPVDINSVIDQHTVRVAVDPVLTSFRVVDVVQPRPVVEP